MIYIVECADQTFYTGWTTDLKRRLKMHNAGRGAKYTRSRIPVRLVYVEDQPSRAAAMQRELEIKRLRRAQKLKLISRFQAKTPIK
jgi:putative endonuclease